MGWQPERDRDSGSAPGSDPVLPGEPLRDSRLSGFVKDGAWDDCQPSAALAVALEGASGAEWRCPGATRDELLGLLNRWQAMEAWAAAGKLGVLRALIRDDDQPLPGGGYRGDLPEGWTKSLTHEVALALSMPAVSAEPLMWTAWNLQAMLPGTGALLAAGRLTLAKARAVEQALSQLTAEDAATAERMIVAGLPGKTYGQAQRLAVQAAITVDPDSATRRREHAEQHQSRVTMYREESGAAALSGRDLPTDQTLTAHARVCDRAEEYKKSGAFPGGSRMDQFRVTAYLDLLNEIPAATRISSGRLATVPRDAKVANDADSPGRTPGGRQSPADAAPHSGEPSAEDAAREPSGAEGTDRQGPLPGDAAPDGAAPDGAAPDGAAPDGAAPDDAAPDGAVPDGAVPDGAGADDDRPDDFGPADPGRDRPGPGGPAPRDPGSGGPAPMAPSAQGPGPGAVGSEHCLGNRTVQERRPAASGPAVDQQPGVTPDQAPPGDAAIPARLADLVLPLATLLGLAERPGEGHGLGPLDPALCRSLAALAAGSPLTKWCMTVTGQDGIAVGHGCVSTARRQRREAGPDALVQVSTGRPLPARANLTISAAHLARLTGQPGQPGRPGQPAGPRMPWEFTRADDSGPPGGFGTWNLTLPGGRNLTVRLGPVPTVACDHRHESHAYQPNDTLRHLVQVRDYECTFPTCSRHARESDFEHCVPYDQGGRTCACNAGARSRACHQVKQSRGWAVTQPRPGWHQWRTPAGRTYLQGPKRYPALPGQIAASR